MALSVGFAAGLMGVDRAQAADPESPSKVVVVTARPIVTAPAAPPLTSTFSEATITSKVLRNIPASPTVSIQTILNGQPSIIAYTNGPLGVGTNIYFRAFNSGEFAETYDGIAINDVFNSSVTGQADNQNNALLQLNNIDSVQIYRGINNPAVNSYNSVGGTINFIPRHPADGAGATIGASYGNFDTDEVHAELDSGELFGVRNLLTVSDQYSQGWSGGHDPDHNLNLFYSGEYNGANGSNLSAFFVYNQNNGHSIFDMPVSLLAAHRGFFQYPQSDEYERDNDTNILGVLDYSTPLSPNIVFDSKIFGGSNNYLRTSYANPADRQSSSQPFVQDNQSESFNFWSGSSFDCNVSGATDCDMYPNGPTYLTGQLFGSAVENGTAYHFYGYSAWALGYTPTLTVQLPSNTIVFGANATYGELHSREYWFSSAPVPQILGFNDAWDEWDERILASIFVQDEVKLFDDKLSITPGVKYIFAHTADHDAVGIFYPFIGRPHDDESFISPTIGVNYKITDELALYGAFGQNIKLPDISAYYNSVIGAYIPGVTTAANATPPVTIRPEHVNDYELGMRYQQGGFSGSLDVYREDFTDTFIDAFNNTLFRTIVSNGGSSTYQGVELQLNEDIGDRPWGDLKLDFSFAYNQANFTSTFITDAVGLSNNNAQVLVHSGAPLADVPNVLVSGGLDWTLDGWEVNAQARYVGSRFVVDTNTGAPSSTTIPSYVVLDVDISKTIPLTGGWAKSIKLSIDARNLTNEYYFNEGQLEQVENAPDGLYAIPGAPRTILGTIEASF